MSRYLSILSVQSPFDVGLDGNGRAQFSVNFEATADAPVTAFEKEIVKILSDAGLVTLASITNGVLTGNTFIGRAVSIPQGDGPFISVINTGGSAPMESHNGQKWERLSAQIIVRATNPATAEAKALAIWRALDGKRNLTVAA